MANLLRLTVKRDERTNKVHLKKGMYVEMICNSRTPSTKEKEKICCAANTHGEGGFSGTIFFSPARKDN